MTLLSIVLAAQLHFGPTWGPWIEFPAFAGRSITTTETEVRQVRLVRTRWNYKTQKYEPPIGPKDAEWLKKNGHHLVDWCWDLKTNGWVKKHKGPPQCLT